MVCASPVGASANFSGDAGRFALLGFSFSARAATKSSLLLGSLEARLKVPFPTPAKKHPSDGAPAPTGEGSGICAPKQGAEIVDWPCSASAPQQPCKMPPFTFHGCHKRRCWLCTPHCHREPKALPAWPLPDPSDGEPGSFCPTERPSSDPAGVGGGRLIGLSPGPPSLAQVASPCCLGASSRAGGKPSHLRSV